MCANRAANRASPAARQKSADLAFVWLMLAVEFEAQGGPRSAEKVAKAAPVHRKDPEQ